MKVLVAPHRNLRGLSKVQTPTSGLGVDGEPVYPGLDLVEVSDLLVLDYATDAHLVSYRIVSPDGEDLSPVPRLRKEALGQLRALGADVRCSVLLVDLDLHHLLGSQEAVSWSSLPDPSQVHDRVNSALRSLDTPPPCLTYATKHGLRFLHALSLDVPAGANYEALVARFLSAYRAVGLPADSACSDWTRLFRCPRVTRTDGEQTWTAPWFRADLLLDDSRFYVPTDEDLRPTDRGSSSPVLRQNLPRPDDSEADDLLWTFRGTDRVLTPLGRLAEEALRSTPVHAYCFGATPFGDPGERHRKLTQVAGILVSTLHSHSWGTPELAYAVLREAVLLLDSDEDWSGKAWEMVSSFWARDSSRVSEETPETVPASPLSSLPEDPEDEFSVDQEGRPYADQRNIRVAVKQLGASLSYDEFSETPLVDGLPGFGPRLDDDAVRRLWLLSDQVFRLKVGKDKFYDVVLDAVHRNRVHPPRDYLSSLIWDGVPRVQDWLTTYLGVIPDDFERAIGQIFLVGAVRRLKSPGCKLDEMLLLEGPQGSLKSSAIQTLAVRPEWFSDDLPLGVDSKEVIEKTRGKWLVEAAELDGMSRRDSERLKAFLSRSSEMARMAYGRLPIERPRQFVIFGTTNKDVYLRDHTGNRRYWCVRVGKVDLDRLRQDRDQLWAEAAHLESLGTSIRLDPSLYPKEAQRQEERRVEDPMFELLEELLEDHEGLVLASDLWEATGIPPSQRTQETNVLFGQVLKRLGFKRVKAFLGGKVRNAYRRGEPNRRLRVVPTGRGTFKVLVEEGVQ